jgi:hypothetical protein
MVYHFYCSKCILNILLGLPIIIQTWSINHLDFYLTILCRPPFFYYFNASTFCGLRIHGITNLIFESNLGIWTSVIFCLSRVDKGITRNSKHKSGFASSSKTYSNNTISIFTGIGCFLYIRIT